jgi:hypothetical protein
MIKDLIQEYRRQNGRHPANMTHYEEDQHCLWHCFHMSRVKEVCHAPECFLEGKAEACAVRSFYRSPEETLRAIIFEQFANNSAHSEVLLFSNNLACAFHSHEYHIFVTVRGW